MKVVFLQISEDMVNDVGTAAQTTGKPQTIVPSLIKLRIHDKVTSFRVCG